MFSAHRNVAAYLRCARETMDYTECHLGMADYGPMLQREVLLNHPTDLAGFDVSRFSSDWATFLGFRRSRMEWQRRCDYLMPECGLYYYVTHYSNWGHPRRYLDPEPQQLLYGPHAYCGIAYNLHDTIGFRESVAAASAFSPYYVFGYLDLRMPDRDVAYARRYLEWVADNAQLLRPGRPCIESEDACVMSKIRDGKGLVYLLNYDAGKRSFKLKLEIGAEGRARIRQVYPSREAEFEARAGATIVVQVRGESTAILDVNRALKTLPPTNTSDFPIDVCRWKKSGDGPKAQFVLPDVHPLLRAAGDPNVPKELLSIDQVQDTDPNCLDRVSIMPGQPMTAVVRWLGIGKLPDQFASAYGFRNGKIVDTWKLAPWAFADRIWFVYRPGKPVPLAGPFPKLEVNGRPVTLFPRVDYRSKTVDTWTCPIFYADITALCRYGEANEVALSNLSEEWPSDCYIASGAR